MRVGRRFCIASAATLAALAGGLAALDRIYPLDIARAHELSAVVTDRDGRMLRAFTAPGGTWRLAATPETVSPLYLKMLLAYEDQRFHDHPGVDPLAMARAIAQWAESGRSISGASTLTMQVARLLTPEPRGIFAKVLQMLRALQLESHLGKAAILSLYLARAPMGGNIEGVRAAALMWFGKEPLHLTAGEAALLVALPQSPASVRPDRHPDAARAARDKVLAVLERRSTISAAMAREARAEPLPRQRRALPFLAAHAAAEARMDAAPAATIVTTIDGKLQTAIEVLLRGELPELSPAANIAALVVEHGSGAVRAYVGSADMAALRRHGHVDMVRAVRSPGSTLKPLIYAMAFDLGVVHPDTIVRDAPTRFGHYKPENFQRHYMGEVTVRSALQHSLNVPAVAVLEAVGAERFSALLAASGVRLHFASDVEKPGLPVALGGTGTSLADLVVLYAALANGGEVRPLSLVPPATGAAVKRLVGASAAWHIARILEAAPPPVETVSDRFAARPREIAFKTGTSYGFRDAWAIGYDNRHTIGVWVGRPDGTPSPDRFGRNTAAPLLFKMFDLLPERRAGASSRPMPVKPPDALEASNYLLPDALRRFDPLAQLPIAAAKGPRAEPLVITFPPTSAVIGLELGRATGTPRLALVAEGGRLPLRWLVNGQPIAARGLSRKTFWPIDGEGFVAITVLDADGASATSQARIKLY